jgi:FtsH-binding integral membrane protein
LYERQYEDAYAEFEKLVLLTDHNLSRSGLQIWRGIAWWKKLRFLYRLLISGVLVLFVMLPVTRVVAWLLISLLTLIALFILQRARWLRETGGPIVFPYAVLTGLFLLSVWHPWR